MHTILNCVIIDDDEIDLLMTISLVKQSSNLNILASYSNTLDAINDNIFQKADVLFLDIDMDGMNGIAFRKMADSVPACIFITAHPEFALDSYTVDTLDFIVKPLNKNRFEEALKRLFNYFEIKTKADLYESNFGSGQIFIKEGNSETKINLFDILYFEALKDYTQIFTLDKNHTILSNLGTLLKQSEFQVFTRIHRSFAVNKDYIKSISSKSIKLTNGQEIPVGRNYKDNLEMLK